MIVWITSGDGSVNYKIEAATPDDAFEKLGRSLGYSGYGAMCVYLGYTGADFNLSVIEIEQGVYDEDGNRRIINQQREGVVLNAFKHLRRVGAQ